ncbi:uncharacterized protein LOC129765524 isoform X2 [Toxorhynchites rutilus septentrionalis]|nr:uncharacterized protein LOC129765524 isoform X2 [Toxorhynchites rutilus septentrionalis]
MTMPEMETTQTITANTTNLINININNGGNLTTIATGENHLRGNDSTPNLTNERAHIEALNVTNDIGDHEPCASLPANYYAIPISTEEVCTNQYCNLNYSSNPNHSLTNKSDVKDVQTYTSQNDSAAPRLPVPQDPSENVTNGCDYLDNRKNQQLPIVNNTVNVSNTASEGIAIATKLRTPGKHLHRTIPRHFGAVDPIINPLKNNRSNVITTHANTSCMNDTGCNLERVDSTFNATKRMSCQCSVQHLPISYLNGHSVLNQPNSESASRLSSGNSRETVMKKHSSSEITKHPNLLHRSAPTQMKPTQAANGHCRGNLKKSHDKFETGDRSTHFNTIYTKTQRVQSKDKCISNVPDTDNHNVLKKQNSLSKKKVFSQNSIKNLNSALSNGPGKTERNCNLLRLDTDVRIPAIVQSHSSNDENIQTKIMSYAATNTTIEQNPELPPKMYKHYNNRSTETHQNSYYSNSKTHAISKPSNDNSKFSISTSSSVGLLRNVEKTQKNYSKSLPRNVISASHGYTQISKSPVQPYSIPDNSIANVNFNTLPKKTNKPSTRSSNLLTEVVNKVPSVINIPSSLLTEVSQRQTQQSTSKQSMKIIPNEGYTRHSAAAAAVISVSKNTAKMEKPLPIFTTSNNCANPKEHFLPNDNSLDDDYLSECENCKSAHGSRYYLEEDIDDIPQETMTLQRKMPENEEDQQNYYRVSSTLPTNTNRKTPTTKNRETWFTTIPASSSSEEEEAAE